MPKYKVLRDFTDIHTEKKYQINEVVTFTKKRANEAILNLELYGGSFLEEVVDGKKEDGGEV